MQYGTRGYVRYVHNDYPRSTANSSIEQHVSHSHVQQLDTLYCYNDRFSPRLESVALFISSRRSTSRSLSQFTPFHSAILSILLSFPFLPAAFFLLLPSFPSLLMTSASQALRDMQNQDIDIEARWKKRRTERGNTGESRQQIEEQLEAATEQMPTRATRRW